MRERHYPLPRNRRLLAVADTVALLGYWVGFVASLVADILRDIARTMQARITRAD